MAQFLFDPKEHGRNVKISDDRSTASTVTRTNQADFGLARAEQPVAQIGETRWRVEVSFRNMDTHGLYTNHNWEVHLGVISHSEAHTFFQPGLDLQSHLCNKKAWCLAWEPKTKSASICLNGEIAKSFSLAKPDWEMPIVFELAYERSDGLRMKSDNLMDEITLPVTDYDGDLFPAVWCYSEACLSETSCRFLSVPVEVVITCFHRGSEVTCTNMVGDEVAIVTVPAGQDPYGWWLGPEVSKVVGCDGYLRLVKADGEIFWEGTEAKLRGAEQKLKKKQQAVFKAKAVIDDLQAQLSKAHDDLAVATTAQDEAESALQKLRGAEARKEKVFGADLQGLTLKALKKIAREEGVTDERIEDTEDAEDPVQSMKDCIVEARKEKASRDAIGIHPGTELSRATVDMAMEITIKPLSSSPFKLEVTSATTIAELKDLIREQQGIAPGRQNIFFRKQLLEDSKSLSELGIAEGSVVVLIIAEEVAFMALAWWPRQEYEEAGLLLENGGRPEAALHLANITGDSTIEYRYRRHDGTVFPPSDRTWKLSPGAATLCNNDDDGYVSYSHYNYPWRHGG